MCSGRSVVAGPEDVSGSGNEVKGNSDADVQSDRSCSHLTVGVRDVFDATLMSKG